MVWILIIMIHWGYETRVESIEFSSREKCYSALEVVKKDAKWNKLVDAYCVEK